MISRKLFVDTLVGIKKEFENRDSAEKELAKLGLRIDADRTPFLESMLEILKEVVPDPYDYIGWWLYDASDYRVSWEEDGQKIEKDLQNPNDLYDFLLDGAVKSTDVETLLADVPAKEYDLAPQKMIEQTDFLRYILLTRRRRNGNAKSMDIWARQFEQRVSCIADRETQAICRD